MKAKELSSAEKFLAGVNSPYVNFTPAKDVARSFHNQRMFKDF